MATPNDLPQTLATDVYATRDDPTFSASPIGQEVAGSAERSSNSAQYPKSASRFADKGVDLSFSGSPFSMRSLVRRWFFGIA